MPLFCAACGLYKHVTPAKQGQEPTAVCNVKMHKKDEGGLFCVLCFVSRTMANVHAPQKQNKGTSA